MKKISVVIPAYNEERYIVKTLRAILAQDYPNFEVIIVNNNSIDRTQQIIEENFSDPRLRVISESKPGIACARSCGLEHSIGEIIAQLDADCIPPKNWLSKGIRYFDDPSVVGLTGPYYYYDAPWYFRLFTILSELLSYPIINSYQQWRKHGAILIGGNTFIRKSTLTYAGGYDTTLNFYGEDANTACLLSKFGKIRYISGLVVKTSARRFKKLGFFSIQKKYTQTFFKLMRGKKIIAGESIEIFHPR